MSLDDRKALAITYGLIHMSVGIEATEDITEDFEHALGAIDHLRFPSRNTSHLF